MSLGVFGDLGLGNQTARPPDKDVLNNSARKDNLYMYYDAGPGRLGNWLFGFASALGIAHHSHRQLICTKHIKRLNNLLPNLDLEIKSEPVWTKWTRMVETRAKDFDPRFFELPEVNVTIGGYLQSFKYFENISAKIFAFFSNVQPNLLQNVNTFMQAAKQKAKHKLLYHNPATIFVHIRRGDLQSKGHKDVGYKMAPLEDVHFAMNWMERKFKQVIFFVASEGHKFCRKNFPQENVFVSNMTSDLEDFVLMQSCDHVIMTVGTFGWWAAWMTSQRGGDVVYYRHPFKVDSSMYLNFDRHSRFPGHWMSYGDNLIIESKDLVD